MAWVNTIDDKVRHVSKSGEAKRALKAGKISQEECDKICAADAAAKAAKS